MTLKLRITGGTRRGRKLLSPPQNTIRPASDMIRQAVFNMVQSTVPGCVFCDIFAGTGIVGIEALSRGAEVAIFVERDRRCIGLLRQNLERARFTRAQADVRTADAFIWARHFLPEDGPTIVFLGPPYDVFKSDRSRLLDMVAAIQQQLKVGDVLVLQFPRTLDAEELPDPGRWHRIRQYGKSRIGIWMPEHASETTADESAADEPGRVSQGAAADPELE